MAEGYNKNQVNAIEYLVCGCQTGFEKYFHLFSSVGSFTVWLSMTSFAFRKSIESVFWHL